MADPGEAQVREAFARFRSETLTDSPAPDLTMVRGIARRRQITRRTMLSVAAVALLAVPALGYRLAAYEAEPPVQPGPVVVASASPSDTASVEPSSNASTSSATVQKPVTKDEIMAATLVIPDWPVKTDLCRSGKVDFDRLGPVTREQHVSVGKVVQTDVDRDGSTEAVAMFSCGYETTVDQVLAIGRDERGALRVFAKVVDSGDADPMMDVYDLRTGRDGAIDVHVGDRINYYEQEFVEKQWRTYQWNGRQFAQVGGPRQFTPVAPSTDTGVAVTATPFGPRSDGMWTASVTLAITNAGPNDAPGVYVDLHVTAPDGGSLSKPLQVSPECTTTEIRTEGRLGGVRLVCHQPRLASGAKREVTYQVRMPVANGAHPLSVVAMVHAEQPGVRVLMDAGEQNNSAYATIASPEG